MDDLTPFANLPSSPSPSSGVQESKGEQPIANFLLMKWLLSSSQTNVDKSLAGLKEHLICQ